MQELTIHEDELEHDRILLERNLQMQHTENSFRLSSADGDDEDNELEYARHGSLPSPEFNFRNSYAADGTPQSQLHVWSYRAGEDDDGVYPYGAESISTSGHHASAVTITAGLAGARNRRGADASLSGAEYDPERPIDAMIAGVEKLSMFDATEPSKSGHSNITFNPLIVDSTAELDRVLRSGHQPPPSLRSRDKSNSQHSRSVRLRSPPRSLSPISSDNENDRNNARPKLTDALRRVSFSPQRPRSPHSASRPSSHLPKTNPSGHRGQPPSPLARAASKPESLLHDQADIPTPRPIRRAASSSVQPPRAHNALAGTSSQPQLRIHPATPSSSTSLAKSARTKAGESKRDPSSRNRHRMPEDRVEYEREQEDLARPPPVSRHVPNHRQATPLRKSSLKMAAGMPRFGKMQLPDVTGLTNAVESPAKMGLGDDDYMSMAGLRRDNTAAREVEARLVRTLNSVQTRLEHLEEENGISRRRVRELEYELEECKREVIKERTRLLEETAELSGVIHAANLARTLGKKSAKGKGKAKESATVAAANLSAAEERYREAVEEKKALESLITSLRSHLARLTSELSEHQVMLEELRSLREKDAAALRDKFVEVDNLKNEVERLAGEVEVLRGVVEEGLRERRRLGREVSADTSVGPEDRGMSIDDNEGDEEHAAAQVHIEEESGASDLEITRPDANANTVTNDDDPWSIDGSSRANTTANPLNNDGDVPTGIVRIDRTNTASPLLVSPRPRLNSPILQRVTAQPRSAEEEGNSDDDQESVADLGRETRSRPVPATPPSHLPPRAPAPTPFHAAIGQDAAAPRQRPDEDQNRTRRMSNESEYQSRKNDGMIHETPFPQIRGEYLEQLFFSAPEHDARTCTACTRRRRPANAHALKGEGHNGELNCCNGDELEDGEDDDNSIAQLLPSRYDRFLKTRRGKETYQPRHVGGSGERKRQAAGADDEGFADGSSEDGQASARPRRTRRDRGKQRAREFEELQQTARNVNEPEVPPPQTVVTRVIRELEDDFTHYKSIYCELADRYKEMDAVSEVRRRNILAQHLKEVVDILEQKGNQIASLYDLLSFKDKLVSESTMPGGKTRNSLWSRKQ